MSPVVTLDRYAEMRAEMDSGRLRDEVLARAGITEEQWLAAQQEWLEKMGKELERDRFELTNRYARAFMERLRMLAELEETEKQTIPAPRPGNAPLASSNEDHPRADTSDPERGPVEPLLPASSPASQPSPWSRHAGDGTPAHAPLQPSYNIAAMPPHLVDAPDGDEDFVYSFAAKEAPRAPVVAASQLAGMPHGADPGETIALAGLVPEIMPFARGSTAGAGAFDEQAFAAPVPARSDEEDGGTMFLTGPVDGPALPFLADLPPGASEEVRTVALHAGERTSGGGPAHDPDEPGATLYLGAALVQHAAPLPFRGEPAPSGAPPLSLEQYAALCAELAVFPDEAEQTFALYSLGSQEARRSVDASFRALLERDPECRRRWNELYTHYRARLASRR